MSYSYKCYSDTKDFMKKFVNAEEGAIIYGISKSRIIVIAREAGAVYKVGNSALINTELFEKYLERFREPARELPKHTWNKLKEIFGTGSGDSAARKLCNTAPSPDSSYSYYSRGHGQSAACRDEG